VFSLVVVGLAAGALHLSGATSATAAANSTMISTFPAISDTRVHEATPTTNYGTRGVLRVDGASDPEIESYLRFAVSGLSGSVQRATIRLHAINDTVDGPAVFGTSDDWVENTVTWNDRPTPTTPAVDNEGPIATGAWAELDVTSLVSADGTVSFVVAATHQDGIDFDSSESTTAAFRPELVVETLTTNAPVAASPPTISGVRQEGETLTADAGTWNGSQPMTFAYQWQRCNAAGADCAVIVNSVAQTYSLTHGDVGATFRVVVTATNADGSGTATSAATGQVIGTGDVVIAAAGDIANCTSSADEATAVLLDSIAPTRVLTLGDNVYPNGTDSEFASCYEPTWGRHRAKTHPSPGNHDYNTPGATGYYNYFGEAAGDPTKGYYAFDLGAWRLYALNSNCGVVPCGPGSAQEQWLRGDLAAHPQSCVAAYMHHPRFSSAMHGNISWVSGLWSALYDHGADLLLAGHDHAYERFTRLDPTGAINLTRGMRSFVVGTGGAGLYPFGTPMTGSEARGTSHGVLRLTLRDGGYDWAFAPIAGSTFTDTGSDTCGAAPSDTTAPSAPTDLVSTAATAGNVALAWTGSTDDMGVVAYDLYRDTQLLATTTTTSFTDTSAVGGSNYQYYATARDAAGNDSVPSNTVTVTVNQPNQPPSITSDGGGSTASPSPAENQTVVTDVDAADPDPDTLTYSIAGGPDAARFSIVPATGVPTFVSAPDFEAPTDVGGNNVYDVTVSVSDGNGGSDSQALAVTVTNVNEFTPLITSDGGGATAALSAPENQTAATDVDASDGDGDVLTYSLTAGPDAGDFTIDPSTGVLAFTTVPDFEAPADANADNRYEVTVTAADASFSDAQAITVEVTDVAEGGNTPPAITSDGGGATASTSVAENQTAVTDVDATDPDPDTLAYSISGGVDMVAFVIDSDTGALTFLTAPDFELPTDTGMNNVYDLVVSVSDGNGGSDTQALAVTVTKVNEFTPLITSNGGGDSAALSRPENQTAVSDVDASDGDGQTLTYSIAGGPDAARFSIVPATGVLTFVSAPDFEAPTDVGGNNVYDVTVQASDGTLADTQAIAVTVTDVAEGGATILYFSVETAQTLSGIPVTPQDIVAFDGQSYSLFVDGSDVGLDASSENIDAFALLADGSVLLSTTGNPSLSGISGGRDEDVLALSPGLRGEVTTGTWAMYLDGGAVGLEASGEDVDAVELLEDGRLLVSTSGAVSVTGVSGADEDVLAYTPGAPGSWALYVDGSDLALTNSAEDVDGVAFRDGTVYLSTTGNFGVVGLSGADEDVFACTSAVTGPTTSCGSFSLFFDGSLFGLAANDLFAIELP
jgi:hypothetical protein